MPTKKPHYVRPRGTSYAIYLRLLSALGTVLAVMSQSSHHVRFVNVSEHACNHTLKYNLHVTTTNALYFCKKEEKKKTQQLSNQSCDFDCVDEPGIIESRCTVKSANMSSMSANSWSASSLNMQREKYWCIHAVHDKRTTHPSSAAASLSVSVLGSATKQPRALERLSNSSSTLPTGVPSNATFGVCMTGLFIRSSKLFLEAAMSCVKSPSCYAASSLCYSLHIRTSLHIEAYRHTLALALTLQKLMKPGLFLIIKIAHSTECTRHHSHTGYGDPPPPPPPPPPFTLGRSLGWGWGSKLTPCKVSSRAAVMSSSEYSLPSVEFPDPPER